MPDLHTRDDMTIDDGSNYNNNPLGERRGNWMEGGLGTKLWPLDPRVEETHIVEIAGSLSRICRYNGHISKKPFYSVAEHSVLLSYLVPRGHAKTALLHDATEYLLGDIVRPLKPDMPGYVNHERRAWHCIADAFGLPHEMPACVKEMDTRILLAEREQLMTKTDHDWGIEGDPPAVVIAGLLPPDAYTLFLDRYYEVCTWPVELI